MKSPAICEDPSFLRGLKKHLEKEYNIYLAQGNNEAASKVAESILLLKLMILDIIDAAAGMNKNAL